MIDLGFLIPDNITVLGLARSGLATVQALVESRKKVYAWDDNETAREQAEKLGAVIVDLAQDDLSSFSMMILSPGIPHTHPAVVKAKKQNLEIICDIELLWRAQQAARFIAITGTNGKSTTTSLTGHILKSANILNEVGGNLGEPVLNFRSLNKDGVYVVEVSSYQLDLSPSFSPDIAILINVSPDHIDRHGSMENYVAAKRHVFNIGASRNTQTAIIGIDDSYGACIYEELKAEGGRNLVPVSVRRECDGVYILNGVLHDGQRKLSFDISGLPNLLGLHNHQNAAMAYAATIALGLRPEQIFSALKTFPGLIYRQQLIAEIKGVRYINDSKATNADSTSKALSSFDNIYWIVGGRPKETGLEGLEEFMPRIRKAFLIGEAQDEFAQWLEDKAPYLKSGTLEQAVAAAHQDAQSEKIDGSIVLLSPACASFDQFKSFEHRGEVFTALVQKIKNDNARLSA